MWVSRKKWLEVSEKAKRWDDLSKASAPALRSPNDLRAAAGLAPVRELRPHSPVKKAVKAVPAKKASKRVTPAKKAKKSR